MLLRACELRGRCNDTWAVVGTGKASGKFSRELDVVAICYLVWTSVGASELGATKTIGVGKIGVRPVVSAVVPVRDLNPEENFLQL